ncbi:hypothetical protein COCNU_06G000030 [Cocos nucifera]|uniref:PABC domain-containing protein n=1 Tax=Cocos nucifera TaxID=13894 RepID=A0A8K0I9H3_COCNU|nr:hypothetical protein COCNU_06G000030 [Cocos nucifera]
MMYCSSLTFAFSCFLVLPVVCILKFEVHSLLTGLTGTLEALDPLIVPQVLMGSVMPVPLDLRSIPVSPMDAVKSPTPFQTTTVASALALATPENQRVMLGERLYPLVEHIEWNQAGKIIGMLLEMDQTVVLHLIESPEALKLKLAEALDVLDTAHATGLDAADRLGWLTLK